MRSGPVSTRKADSLAVVVRKLLRTRFLYAVGRAKVARCLWAFFRRSDAAISQTAFSTKTPAQSSKSGVNRNHQLQEELRRPLVRRTGLYGSCVTQSLCSKTANLRATATSAFLRAFFPLDGVPSVGERCPCRTDPECDWHIRPADCASTYCRLW